jgi:hypothetical protein
MLLAPTTAAVLSAHSAAQSCQLASSGPSPVHSVRRGKTVVGRAKCLGWALARTWHGRDGLACQLGQPGRSHWRHGHACRLCISAHERSVFTNMGTLVCVPRSVRVLAPAQGRWRRRAQRRRRCRPARGPWQPGTPAARRPRCPAPAGRAETPTPSRRGPRVVWSVQAVLVVVRAVSLPAQPGHGWCWVSPQCRQPRACLQLPFLLLLWRSKWRRQQQRAAAPAALPAPPPGRSPSTHPQEAPSRPRQAASRP